MIQVKNIRKKKKGINFGSCEKYVQVLGNKKKFLPLRKVLPIRSQKAWCHDSMTLLGYAAQGVCYSLGSMGPLCWEGSTSVQSFSRRGGVLTQQLHILSSPQPAAA